MKKWFVFLFLCATCYALPTYFTYPKPIGSSKFVITQQSVDKWDPIFKEMFAGQESEKSDPKAFDFFTYLYIAERDAAFLSYNAQNCFEGSLDPLIVKITTLFYPDSLLPTDYEQDAYSQALAQTVFNKFKERYAENEKNKWLLWYSNNYEVPPPPHTVMHEMKKFHKIRRTMNAREEALGAEWENIGLPGTKNWITICNKQIEENGVDIGSTLQMRAVLMLSLSDANSIAMAAKEKYQIPRPFQVETHFVPSIKKPSTPSYPSSHAALAGAGAEVMGCFFPGQSKEWARLAKECAYSRIWSGVHYPMDVHEGLLIGKEVAKEVVSKQ